MGDLHGARNRSTLGVSQHPFWRNCRIRLKFVVQGEHLPVGRLINQNQPGSRRGAGLNRDRTLALNYVNRPQSLTPLLVSGPPQVCDAQTTTDALIYFTFTHT